MLSHTPPSTTLSENSARITRDKAKAMTLNPSDPSVCGRWVSDTRLRNALVVDVASRDCPEVRFCSVVRPESGQSFTIETSERLTS